MKFIASHEAAIERACYRYEPGEGILFHSDRGCQYASTAFRQMLERKGFISSMSRKGNCYDNAALESFWSTLKAEVVPSKGFESLAQARLVLFGYIECFYNRSRLHSSLGYQSPVEYEQCYYRQFTLASVSTNSGQVHLADSGPRSQWASCPQVPWHIVPQMSQRCSPP
ncbi:MAG: hypothetical protein DIKNOCCD_02151 [bacterium]|nr:transposase [bacterium]MBV6482408.1 hypothetical protein [bacterium]MCE7909832.1 hypothetical protein [Candidatus Omnitrophica bacterium COP1]